MRRAVNGQYWVFAGGLTNVGVQLQVTDTQTGVVETYSNAVGTPFSADPGLIRVSVPVTGSLPAD